MTNIIFRGAMKNHTSYILIKMLENDKYQTLKKHCQMDLFNRLEFSLGTLFSYINMMLNLSMCLKDFITLIL